jgi:hypothetical protein
MATAQNTYRPQEYTVIHPLHDLPEQKCTSSGLGRIKMTRAVRISLLLLRAYLVAIMLILAYQVMVLAGVFHGLK